MDIRRLADDIHAATADLETLVDALDEMGKSDFMNLWRDVGILQVWIESHGTHMDWLVVVGD